MEKLLLQAHFSTDPCHIIRSCLSQTQTTAVKHNLMVFLQQSGLREFVYMCGFASVRKQEGPKMEILTSIVILMCILEARSMNSLYF